MMSALMRAKCVVSPTGGSFEGLAMAMDIPIVRVRCDLGYRNKDGSMYDDDVKGTYMSDIDDIIHTIGEVDDKLHENERREVAVDEMGVNFLPALDNIIKEIDQWL
jgi:hypothetical protein